MQHPLKPLLVALVEDDPRIRQLIEDEIVDEGHSCLCFNSAEAFLEALPDLSVNLLLLDLMLPGMNGLDCLRALQTIPSPVTRHIAVVTALNDTEKRDRALELGADDYILKPDLFERLPELLRSLHSN